MQKGLVRFWEKQHCKEFSTNPIERVDVAPVMKQITQVTSRKQTRN